ncbi:MAG: hypothetical protein RIM99_10075 [Cyclobacteriaceae bacterium]
MSKEPVALINSIIAIIEAALVVAVGLGLNWTPEQIAGVMALIIAIGNAIKTYLARKQVTPVSDPRDNNGNSLKPN